MSQDTEQRNKSDPLLTRVCTVSSKFFSEGLFGINGFWSCLSGTRWMQENSFYKYASQVPPEMRRTFLSLTLDDETRQFLDNCNEKSDALLTQIWHSIVKSLLRWFLTQTDING
ncbi:Methyltransferase-like protein 9 [Homalodisca vitripennis]|nr:Methyltransferase-like protein 9 [Homalodisca vitripennis]